MLILKTQRKILLMKPSFVKNAQFDHLKGTCHRTDKVRLSTHISHSPNDGKGV